MADLPAQRLQNGAHVLGVEGDVVDHRVEVATAQRRRQHRGVTAVGRDVLDSLQRERLPGASGEDGHLVAALEQMLRDAATQEAGPADDEDASPRQTRG